MKLKIKIGDMKEGVKEVFRHPEKIEAGTHSLYLKSPHELYELLTPKRIELLRFALQNNKEPITAISKALKRKQEAISRDAAILEKYSLITKTRDNKKTYIKSKYNTLEITLAN